ncbi:DUF4158 domain-containing protein [Cupriavidus sp. LEh21]|nr:MULTISPECIES: DUF4158 domain-containing protein [unclassified Cupriavidus]MDK2657545.1 DUF4158 domain-containing protein [Cupriavidus sp. LEh21]
MQPDWAEEIEWAQGFARTAERRLALLVNLKCFQILRHFPAVEAVPAEVVERVSACLGMAPVQRITIPPRIPRSIGITR